VVFSEKIPGPAIPVIPKQEWGHLHEITPPDGVVVEAFCGMKRVPDAVRCE
jgi:hypothetical protein